MVRHQLQRFVATLLLFCVTLQSCTQNAFSSFPAPHALPKPTESEPSGDLLPRDSENEPVAPHKRRLASSPRPTPPEDKSVSDPTTLPLPARTLEALVWDKKRIVPLCNGTRARVEESLKGFSRVSEMPIVYTPGYTWSDLVASHPRRLPFLLRRHTDPKTHQPYLHVGSQGLLGGGKNNTYRKTLLPFITDDTQQRALEHYQNAKEALRELGLCLQEASHLSRDTSAHTKCVHRAQEIHDWIDRQLSKAESYCDTGWIRIQLRQHQAQLQQLKKPNCPHPLRIERKVGTSPLDLLYKSPSIKTQISSWIDRYAASLGPAQREYFEQSVRPVLLKHLPRATPKNLKALFAHWKRDSIIYTRILERVAPERWLCESRILDILHDARGEQQTITSDIFYRALQKTEAACNDFSLYDRFVAALFSRYRQGAGLKELCQILKVLPQDVETSTQLLEDQVPFAELYAQWLDRALAGLTQFSKADRHMLRRMFLKERYSTSLVQQLIAEATLLQTQPDVPTSPQAFNKWICHVEKKLCAQSLQKIFSEKAGRIQSTAEKIFGQETKLFVQLEEIAEIQRKAACATGAPAQEIKRSAEAVIQTLEMLHDYGADQTTCRAVLAFLKKHPYAIWTSNVHAHLVKITFERPYRRDLQEIVQYISKRSPGVLGYELKRRYNEVGRAYDTLSEAYKKISKPICDWNADDIKAWAQYVKPEASKEGNGDHKIKNRVAQDTPKCKASKAETLAVIRRAVALHHKFLPRDTQLLSVLLMLDRPKHLGRLAQINTGEGKSLIVAMLAAYYALQGQKVDVVTTSTELSVPEVKKQKGFFELLSLQADHNSKGDGYNSREKEESRTKEESREKEESRTKEEMEKAYASDVLYGTAQDFQGDILRTEVEDADCRGNRGFDMVIVDEVDNMLYDSRDHATRLSSPIPAMNHLEVVMAAIWAQVDQVQRHSFDKDGNTYFVPEPFEEIQGKIRPFSGRSFEEVAISIPTEDREQFIIKSVHAPMRVMLRSLSESEKQAQEYHRAKAKEVMRFHHQLSKNSNVTEAQKHELREMQAELEGSEWSRCDPYIAVPNHLREFVKAQLPRWIKNAVQARFIYTKGQHYDVAEDKIVPVDYDNTGVLQHDMVWSDGLTQFLQIKEGLPLEPESFSTNSLSAVGYFKRYGNNLCGLTGTLGNNSTRSFLSDIYNVDRVVVPPYKYRPVSGNEDSQYICKEFPARIFSTDSAWSRYVVESVLRAARQGRAVLVICKSINQVDKLDEQLKSQYVSDKVDTYKRQTDFKRERIGAGEIIVATNIAGRGTDLITSEEVEKNGGMHVCITFLPNSNRVEMQNAGRTARQGKKGSAQLVIHHPTSQSIAELRGERSIQEDRAIAAAKQDIARALLRDQLFDKFRALEEKILPSIKVSLKAELLNKANKSWEEHKNSNSYEKDLRSLYDELKTKRDKAEDISKKLLDVKAHVVAKEGEDKVLMLKAEKLLAQLHNHNEALCRYNKKSYQKSDQTSILEADCQAAPMPAWSTFLEVHNAEEKDRFCKRHLSKYPPDVLECFRQSVGFESTCQEADKQTLQKRWVKHERDAVRERWGIWLKINLTPEAQEKELMNQFERFAHTVRQDAQENTLVKNPYYYVQKGNTFSKKSFYARECYARAIQLDKRYSVPARYNKAWTLLTPESNQYNYEAATEELEECKFLLQDQYKEELFSTQGFIGQTGNKPKLFEHLQHQMNVLVRQEAYMDQALGVIDEARSKSWNVKLEKDAHKTLAEAFDTEATKHDKAIQKAQPLGLTHLFVVSAKEPTPWGSVLAVAAIGLAQIAVGCIVVACTGGAIGSGLIKEGVSDLITAAKAAISGKFSWEEWSTQKMINVTISLISGALTTGWMHFKQACKDLKDTVVKVGQTIKDFGQNIGTHLKSGVQLAKETLKLALTQGIAQELTNAVIDYSTEKMLMEAVQEHIDAKVEKAILAALQEDQLIQKALSLDQEKGTNQWQDKIIRLGIEVLNEEDKREGQYSSFKAIAEGVGRNVLPDLLTKLHTDKNEAPSSNTRWLSNVAMRAPRIIRTLKDIHDLAHRRTRLIRKHVKEKYKRDIDKAKEALDKKKKEEKDRKKQKAKGRAQQRFQQEVITPFPVDNGLNSLQIQRIDPRTNCVIQKPEGKEYTHFPQLQNDHCVPSSNKHICRALKPYMSGKITQGIRSHFVRPVTNKVVSMGMDCIFREANQTVAEATHKFRAQHLYIQSAQDFTKAKKTSQKKSLTQPVLERQTEQLIYEIEQGLPADLARCALLSHATKVRIAIYDHAGELIEILGQTDGAETIHLQYFEPTGPNIGHWAPKNPDVEVEDTGLTTCLEDAAVACLKRHEGFQNITRENLGAQMIASLEANPKMAQELHTARAHVEYYYPESLYRGAGWIAYTADALQKVDKWLEDHSFVADCLSLFSQVASIGKATPQAVVISYVADCIQEKISANIPIDDIRNSSVEYLQSLDDELTREQATYLFEKARAMADDIGFTYTHRFVRKNVQKHLSSVARNLRDSVKTGTWQKHVFATPNQAPHNPGNILNQEKSPGGKGTSNKQQNAPVRSEKPKIKINQLNKLIRTGKLPKTIERFDQGKIYKEQAHVHFIDGAALNVDGTWKHGCRRLNKKEVEFLAQHGWTLPE